MHVGSFWKEIDNFRMAFSLNTFHPKNIIAITKNEINYVALASYAKSSNNICLYEFVF